jgi:DNA-binding helix-hairpin-helix protein with protein kinase domain
MATSKLFDHLGHPLTLGTELGKGGEGTVFNVANEPNLVAKVYHNAVSTHHESKLRAMMGLARKELCAIAAWPTATLHARPGGRVCGLVMRKIKDFSEIHFLYSPAHRKARLPHADWRFLIHTAMNCAAAFDTVHSFGVVIGDVNQSNVFVSGQGLVSLIDCDSYQLQCNGQLYPCEVGIDLFTPPELQGRPFRGVVRTPNHDRFGLAVLIFYLLFMNRHPFAGRYLGQGEMPIEKAIKQHYFAYSRSAQTYQMQTPLHALPLSAVSSQVVDFFERAFGPVSAQQNLRPTAADWVTALKAMLASLRSCTSDPGHVYASHLANCPWCGLMRQGAPNFFITVAYSRAAASPGGVPFALSVVWNRIEHVPRPGAAYMRPAIPPASSQWPWPANLARTVPPRPRPPAVLVSPPAPIAMPLVRPKRSKTAVKASPVQNIVAVTGIVCGIAFAPLLVCALFLRAAGSGWLPATIGVLGIGALLGLMVSGLLWLVFETTRLLGERQLNAEYLAELAELRAEARRKHELWESQLREKQAEARRRHDLDVASWEKAVAALQAEAQRRRTNVAEARRRVDAGEESWSNAALRLGREFDGKKLGLTNMRNRHNELAGEYATERQRLHVCAREMQLKQFLQQKFISDDKISKIGPGRTATLSSYGIETAFDVVEDKIVQVPGFKEELTRRLIQWRRTMESQFAFNAAAGIPVHEQQALDATFAQARQQVEALLLAGERDLKGFALSAENELRQLSEHIKSALLQLSHAIADMGTIPPGL